MSVGLGDVAIHIEVPGDLGKSKLDSFQLRDQHNLAAQPRVLLEQWRHVQHVVLPGTKDSGQGWGNLRELEVHSRALGTGRQMPAV